MYLQLTIQINEEIKELAYYLSTLLDLLTALLRWSPHITHLFLHLNLRPALCFAWREDVQAIQISKTI